MHEDQNIDVNSFDIVSSRIIMNADLNAAGKLFGGVIMAWIDEAAAMYCMEKLKTKHIVTKKFSEVLFNEPAHLGDLVELRCRVKDVGTTSLTIECIAPTKVIQAGDTQRVIVHCDVVFVSIDRNGRPTPHQLKKNK